nr:acyltransferase [Asticcacaulis aquaticus]
MRFLAAGFILLFHFGESAPRDLHEVSPVLAQGWLATDFFLMLSGFILMRAYGPRLQEGRVSPFNFVKKRFLRLWPSHVVVLLLMFIVVTLATLKGHPPGHMEKYGVWSFWEQFFLIHGWGLSEEPGWNVPTWTLSALILCYVLFTLYVPMVRRWKPWALAGGIVAVLALGFVVAAFADHAFVDLPFRWGLVRAIPLFIAGSLLERMVAHMRVPKRVYAAGLTICLLGIIGLASLPRHAFCDVVILSLLAGVLTLSASVTLNENHLTKRMGRASFSLFLTHSLVGAIALGLDGMLMARIGVDPVAHWGLWGLSIVAAIVVAFAFDALIDMPLSQLVSQRLSSGSGTAPDKSNRRLLRR